MNVKELEVTVAELSAQLKVAERALAEARGELELVQRKFAYVEDSPEAQKAIAEAERQACEAEARFQELQAVHEETMKKLEAERKRLQDLRDRALRILDKAESSRDLRVSLQAIREARQCVELLAKLAGELSEAPQVNILLSPQWVKLRKTILIALEPFPEARTKVAEVLSHGGG